LFFGSELSDKQLTVDALMVHSSEVVWVVT